MKLFVRTVEGAVACLALLIMFDAGRAHSARAESDGHVVRCVQLLEATLTQAEEAGALMLSTDERLVLALIQGRPGRSSDQPVAATDFHGGGS